MRNLTRTCGHDHPDCIAHGRPIHFSTSHDQVNEGLSAWLAYGLMYRGSRTRVAPLLSGSPANGMRSDRSSDCPRRIFRYAQGGTGAGSAHKPFLASLASFSSLSSSVSSGAYFGYHQHTPPKQLCHAGVQVHASCLFLPERIVQEFRESDTGFGQLLIDHGHIGSVILFTQLAIFRQPVHVVPRDVV